MFTTIKTDNVPSIGKMYVKRFLQRHQDLKI